MRAYIYSLVMLLACYTDAQAGKKIRVLFIGNSYTYVNNMPQILADMATSAADTLIWEMEAPGGFTLNSHYLYNPPTINKIKQGNWNYVIMQEQSQTPALPAIQVQNGMFPYARKLDSLVHQYNNCATTVFYQTWGRKYGDTSLCAYYRDNLNWPYFCTYEGMDSVIRTRYLLLADSNLAAISPVGAVWHYIRLNYPSINLYDSDESHPSPAGSYAAGCAFYTALFGKDPAAITYQYLPDSTMAAHIRLAARRVVYDSLLYWHIGQYHLNAGFSYTPGQGNTIIISNTSLNATGYSWDFGDGQTSTANNPTHTYANTGNYTIRLIATNSNCSDTTYAVIKLHPDGTNDIVKQNTFIISPNPVEQTLLITSSFSIGNKYRIQIINSTGQVTYDQVHIAAKQYPIDISTYRAGIYAIIITEKGRMVYNTRIVKL